MYKIIGADGKEYGPVSADQLRQWLNEGRVNAQTKILAEGATEWKTLVEFPEFSSAAPITPPTLTHQPAVAPAADQVRGPAIFILVLAILDILMGLFGIAAAAFQFSIPAMLHLPEQQGQFEQQWSVLFSLPANCIGIAISVVCLVGALRMMNLRSYGLAMASAILMMIPCGTCCCLINIGAGIWALVVLSKPEVKSVFR